MWEYKSIADASLALLTEKANRLGEEGWEAFGFATTQSGLGLTGVHMMVFRRRIEIRTS
jgi:hypothetical protein